MLLKRSIWKALTATLRLKSQKELSYKPTENRFGVDFDLNGENNFSQPTERRTYEKMPLKKEILKILSKFRQSEMLEQFYKEKGEVSSEEQMSNLFNSLSTKEGYIAWAELSETERENLVDNFLLIMQECLAVQMRFSTNFCAKVLFKLIASTTSNELGLRLLNELLKTIRSPNIKLNIVYSYLVSGVSVRSVFRSQCYQEGALLCENTLYEIFSDKRLRIDGRSVNAHCSSLASYFDFASRGSQIDTAKCQFLTDYFMSLPVNEMPPFAFMMGYSSLMSLQNTRKIRVATDNVNNVEFMNYVLKKFIYVDRSEERGEEEEQSVKGNIEFQVVLREEIPSSVVFQFIQGCFIENEDNWKNKTQLLSILGDKMEKRHPEEVLRKWVFRQYVTNAEEMDSRKMIHVCKNLTNFLSLRGSHKLKMKFFRNYAENFRKLNDPNIACQVLNLMTCFRTVLNQDLPKDVSKFDPEKDITAADKDLLIELYDMLSKKAMENSKSLQLVSALELITLFLGTFAKMTISDLKSLELHDQTWERAKAKEYGRGVIFQMFNAFSHYDLVSDQEMQANFLTFMNKVTEDIDNSVKKRRPALPKSFYVIFDALSEQKESLSEEGKLVMSKLEVLKSLRDAN